MSSRIWSFKEFVTSGGRLIITDECDPEVRDELDDRLRFMATTRIHLWGPKRFQWLVDYPKIGEIRFVAKKVQQRPLCCSGPGSGDFTILILATERGGKFVPRDAAQQAEGRRTAVHNDPERAKKYAF